MFWIFNIPHQWFQGCAWSSCFSRGNANKMKDLFNVSDTRKSDVSFASNNNTSTLRNHTFELRLAMGPEPLIWITLTHTISCISSLWFVVLLLAFFYSQRDVLSGSGLLIVHLTLIEFTVVAAVMPAINTVSYYGIVDPSVDTKVDCPKALLAAIVVQCAGNFASLILSVVRLIASVAPQAYTMLTVR